MTGTTDPDRVPPLALPFMAVTTSFVSYSALITCVGSNVIVTLFPFGLVGSTSI